MEDVCSFYIENGMNSIRMLMLIRKGNVSSLRVLLPPLLGGESKFF